MTPLLFPWMLTACPATDTVDSESAAADTETGDSSELPAIETGDTAPPPAWLATDQASYDVGERILISFGGAAGTPTDWIGLYPADQVENEGSTTWLYTSGTSEPGAAGVVAGELRFLPINLPDGAWEARLFHEDGYEPDVRLAFTVADPGQVAAPAPVGDLTVMSFNAWLNGNGVTDGVEKIASAVVACNPDLVAFQEAGPNFGTAVVAALALVDPGWAGASIATDGTDNTIVSRLPLSDISGEEGGYSVRATLQVASGAAVAIVGSHFDYTEYGPWLARDGSTADRIEATETRVRGDDAARVIAALAGAGAALVLGDHNAPSHLDWTPANADQNFDLVVDWPTSIAFADAGFVDAYRTVLPQVASDRGLTWSPGYPKGELDPDDVHDRIDFVYHRDGDVVFTPVQAYTYAADPWPSDHRAVVVSYELE